MEDTLGAAYILFKVLIKFDKIPEKFVYKLYNQFLIRLFIKVFVANAPFLYPLKTSENLSVFEYFQGVVKGRIWNKWVESSKFSLKGADSVSV